ncbi:MAG: hypothetical protein JWP27_1158, partial [Flaviaesturariibacter sp.]|nr:hypothetical protein [Flaviaesturariibacter sp.]
DGSAELAPKIVGSVGIRFAVTEASYLTLQGDFSKQGDYREFIGGFLYGFKLGEDFEKPKYTIHGGLMMRANDALIPVVKLDYSPFSVSVSYDANTSSLKTSSMGRGGFEVGISFIGFRKTRAEDPTFSHCPRF